MWSVITQLKLMESRAASFQELIPSSDSESNSNDYSAEGGIQIVLGPTPLDDTPDTTRLNANNPSTDESSSESDVPATPLRRSTQQKRPAPSCTVCDQNRGGAR